MDTVSRARGMFTPASDMDPVMRAETYPYLIPDTSYVFTDGHWVAADLDAGLVAGRPPVIACGSNRSPEQLARKFADFAEVTIPVERAWLTDFDVVYAAHLTGYGAVAANLHPVPGMSVEVSVTWLSDDLMDRMHATEGLGAHYDYAHVRGLALDLECTGPRNDALGYIYRLGSLRVGSGPVGLAEVSAHGRRHAAWLQPAALDHVRQRIGHPGPRARFILETVGDQALRRQQEAVLQEDALPFEWPDLTVLEGGPCLSAASRFREGGEMPAGGSAFAVILLAGLAASAQPAAADEAMATICRPTTRCGPTAGPERLCRSVNRCHTIQTQRRVPVDVLKCTVSTAPHHYGRRCIRVTRYRYVRVPIRRCNLRTVCSRPHRPSAGACTTVNICRRVPLRLLPRRGGWPGH